MQRKLGPLWRGDSISNRRTPSSCRAAKPRTPSSTKLNRAPPLRTEETVYLIMDWTKPLRSELGKENLDHVNGGRASEWAPGLGVVQVLQRLTFWENCKPPSLEPMSKHRVQENVQEGGQSLSSMQPNTSKQQPSKATPASNEKWKPPAALVSEGGATCP